MSAPDDLPCAQFVEAVTDYLDGALAPGELARLEEHLAECPGCASVLEQMRIVVKMSGRLREHDVRALDPSVREPLVAAFRELQRGR